MTFEQNLKLLKIYLKRYGWEYKSTDGFFDYYQNYLNLELKFPIQKDDAQFPQTFEISLSKIKKLCPEISELPLLNVLNSQTKNMRQKHSKVKNKWILSEPSSKYTSKEIPDIYVPKNSTFEERE
jgi:hypothetical protein